MCIRDRPKIGPDMEYKNIAGQAKVKATNVAEGSSANLLTDGVIKIFSWDEFLDEFTTDKKGKTTITLTFDDYVTVRALMVYNSYDYNYHWESIDRVEMDFTRTVNGSTVTGLSLIHIFKDEYIAHVRDKKCPAGVCKALVSYEIDPALCVGCGLCKRGCPVGAISGEIRQVHVIDPKKCIKCGACIAACRKNAIKK